MGTEDDTFRRLKRSTFEEVRQSLVGNAVLNRYIAGIEIALLEDTAPIYERHGWTRYEYLTEQQRRAKHDPNSL